MVVGQGARPCGACHRSQMINEDAFGALVAFDQHTKANGYAGEDYDSVMATIMSYFGYTSYTGDTGTVMGEDITPENCVICHAGAGEDHQAVYDACIDIH